MTKKKPKVSPATPINREAAAAARASFRENFPEADAELFPRTSPPEDVQARARAKGPDPEAWALFCQGVAEGKVERIAAMATGIPYTTLRGWMEQEPALREQLLDARAVEIQRRLDRMEHTPMTMGGEDGMPDKAAELLMKHDRWRLEGLDPHMFLPAKRVETTGAEGGPVKQEIAFTVAELREIAKGTTE